MSNNGFLRTMSVAASLLLLAGCGDSPLPYAGNGSSGGSDALPYFKDSVQSNASMEGGELGDLSFIDINGSPVKLNEFFGQKNLVLVFTRGYAGYICPYCSTQTSRLIARYEEFVDRNSEVVVVYPVLQDAEAGHLDEFLKSARAELTSPNKPIPFPILLDVKMNAVDQLEIRQALAKPATYIFDSQGQVRFAYVGSNAADRPSIKAMLQQLSALNSDKRDAVKESNE